MIVLEYTLVPVVAVLGFSAATIRQPSAAVASSLA